MMSDQLEDWMNQDRERQSNCRHDDAFIVDDALWCPECDSIIAVTCYVCGGDGHTHEDDYECDWINYSHQLITCPDCGGDGWDYSQLMTIQVVKS